MALQEVYFWTNTILDWKHLLHKDEFKTIIINSWRTLVERGKVTVYGYVIMPNHLHVLWEMKELNGKEMPHASFNKFTSHQFLSTLRLKDALFLTEFKQENGQERNHRFWQRDALAVLMDSTKKFEQKLDYIHLNPLQEKWNLASKPENYVWSSASFYENGVDPFNILTHYKERF